MSMNCDSPVIDEAMNKVNNALSKGSCKKWFRDHGQDVINVTPDSTVTCHTCKIQCCLGIPAWTYPGMGIGVCNNQIDKYDASGWAALLIHELAHHYCPLWGREECANSAMDACGYGN